MKPHFTALEAAYQLHYYLYLKTNYLRPSFQPEARALVTEVLSEVCAREQYHLLEPPVINPNHLKLLLSLEPNHCVSDVIKKLKGNISRRLGPLPAGKLWARGYFARTSGKVDLVRARDYVAQQVQHHGYRGDWTKALKFHNLDFTSPCFSFEHCFAQLNYHLVLSTYNRATIFDEAIAPSLFNYILAIGRKHKFAVERIGLLPDHLHLLVEAVPSISVQQIVQAILDSTFFWMHKNYFGVLKETDALNVWSPSFYAGSVGEFTTAQVKRFLSNG